MNQYSNGHDQDDQDNILDLSEARKKLNTKAKQKNSEKIVKQQNHSRMTTKNQQSFTDLAQRHKWAKVLQYVLFFILLFYLARTCGTLTH